MQQHRIALGIAGALMSLSAMANELGHNWLGGFIEHYEVDSDKPDSNTNMDDGTHPGLEVGIAISPDWSFRLAYADMQIDHQQDPAIDRDGNRFGVDALYFHDNPDIYTFVGYKVENWQQTYRLGNLGVGKHWHLNDRWRVISEAAAYYDFGDGYTDVGFKLGIAYHFGASSSHPTASEAAPEPAPQPARVMPPKDSDNDGVADASDNCANTPGEDQVDAEGCSILVEESVTMDLEVRFAHDSADIDNPDAEQFREFKAFMQRFPNTKATIEGHTSVVGSETYNMTLSQQRAQAVKALLIDRYDIAPERLSAKGYGETRPKNPANTADAHRQNRRIEAKIRATVKKALKR